MPPLSTALKEFFCCICIYTPCFLHMYPVILHLNLRFAAFYMDETVYAQTTLLIVLFSRPCYTICKVAHALPAVPFGLGFGSSLFFILAVNV